MLRALVSTLIATLITVLALVLITVIIHALGFGWLNLIALPLGTLAAFLALGFVIGKNSRAHEPWGFAVFRERIADGIIPLVVGTVLGGIANIITFMGGNPLTQAVVVTAIVGVFTTFATGKAMKTLPLRPIDVGVPEVAIERIRDRAFAWSGVRNIEPNIILDGGDLLVELPDEMRELDDEILAERFQGFEFYGREGDSVRLSMPREEREADDHDRDIRVRDLPAGWGDA